MTVNTLHAAVIAVITSIVLAVPAWGQEKPVTTQESKDNRLLIAEKADLRADVTFKTVEGKDLKLDFFVPKGTPSKAYPTVVFVHGGGWTTGSKSSAVYADRFFVAMTGLLSRGIQVVSIDYRLADETHHYKELIGDCKDAIRWLRKNAAEQKVDAARLGVWGPSAGGHLVLMMALTGDDQFAGDPALAGTSAKVNFAVSWYGPTQFLSPKWNSGAGPKAFNVLLGGPPDQAAEAYKEASPINYLKKDSVPILLCHGTKDPTVPLEQSKAMAEKGKELGADVKLIVVENAAHNFNPSGGTPAPTLEEIQKACVDFMIANLRLGEAGK